MYTQTTANVVNDFFTSITFNPLRSKPNNRLVTIKRDHSDALLQFTNPVTITENKGLALLVTTLDPQDPEGFHYFILKNAIEIHPEVYFNTLALTDECQLYLEPTNNEEPKIITVSERMKVDYPQDKIKVSRIYGSHYQVYGKREYFRQNNSNYYELMIVDQGSAKLVLSNNHQYVLNKNHAWLNKPNHELTVRFDNQVMTTLVSILFDVEGLDEEVTQQPITLGHRQLQLVERIIKLSNKENMEDTHAYDEMVSSLQLLLVHFMVGKTAKHEVVSTSMKENYENEMFREIVEYLEEDIANRNKVSDLVSHFAVSRSTLQMLFRKYADTTPKAFINSLRLKQSKVLMHESSLSLSEIANDLGYGSIQYFSRAFSREFGTSPSIYAKSILR